jgi:hypothetical protein
VPAPIAAPRGSGAGRGHDMFRLEVNPDLFVAYPQDVAMSLCNDVCTYRRDGTWLSVSSRFKGGRVSRFTLPPYSLGLLARFLRDRRRAGPILTTSFPAPTNGPRPACAAGTSPGRMPSAVT